MPSLLIRPTTAPEKSNNHAIKTSKLLSRCIKMQIEITPGLQRDVNDSGSQADHRRGFNAEAGSDRIGSAEADAADHPRSQVFFDPLSRGGR